MKRVALGFDTLGFTVELYQIGGVFHLVTVDCETEHSDTCEAFAAFNSEACVQVVDGGS